MIRTHLWKYKIQFKINKRPPFKTINAETSRRKSQGIPFQMSE